MAQIKQKCDFCDTPAVYDGKTKMGPWAFMCDRHFSTVGINQKGLFNKLDVTVATKRCYACGQDKAVTDFYRYTDHSGIERYRNECKACNLQIRKERSFK